MKSSFVSLVFMAQIFILSACVSPRKSPETVAPVSPSVHLTNGKKLLSKGQFEEAFGEFEMVLKNQTTTPEIPKALFYSAVALQELKRWQEASERFRKYTTSYGTQNGEQIPEAFYRLGLCFEALGDRAGAIAAYTDALNRLTKTRTPLRAELEARLAGIYAKMGNEQESQKFYDAAEKDIMGLRRQFSSQDLPPWLPETLFNMGKMSIRPIVLEDFESGLRSFERAQIWLLRVARLNDKNWSELAAQEIVKVYTDSWAVIESVPLFEDSDKVLALKEQQDKKITMAVSIYNLLTRLKLERGYDFAVENKFEKSVFDSLGEVESRLENLLKSRPVEQGLTQSAMEREGLKREVKRAPRKKPANEQENELRKDLPPKLKK